MSNYDYNKGYKWFRFQKETAIDSAVPPLCSYRSMREVSPLQWVSNAEHVANNDGGHVHHGKVLNRGGTKDVRSVHLPIILASSVSTVSPSRSFCLHDTPLAEWCMAGGNRAPPLQKQSASLLLEIEAKAPCSQQSQTPKTCPRLKSRAERKPAKRNRSNETHKRLEDCLFIQNGVQRFPGNHRGFLSSEKERL